MYSSVKKSAVAVAFACYSLGAAAAPSNELLIWDQDPIQDERQSGKLGNIDVTLYQRNFDNPFLDNQYGGGTTVNMDWAGVDSFSDIIGDWNTAPSQQAAVLEWASGDTLFVELTFSQEVTDPVLFFTGLSGRSQRAQDFGFDFGSTLNLLAWSDDVGARINTRNNHLVTIDGSDAGSLNNGIAVQLEGTYDYIYFLANGQRDIADTALFSMGATIDAENTYGWGDKPERNVNFAGNSFATASTAEFDTGRVGSTLFLNSSAARGTTLNASSVPEPAPIGIMLAGAIALVIARRRLPESA